MTRTHPSSLASALRAFLTDYLPQQRALSPHTLHSYRDSLKLLLQFVAGKKANPGRLTMEHLTYRTRHGVLAPFGDGAEQPGQHTERAAQRHPVLLPLRGRTLSRTLRWPAHPECPAEANGVAEIQHLELSEIQAILGGIDRSTAEGAPRSCPVEPLVQHRGQGQRSCGIASVRSGPGPAPKRPPPRQGPEGTPLPTVGGDGEALRAHLREYKVAPHEPRSVFLNHRGQPLTRFGVRWILRKHVRKAALRVISLKSKRLHPHSVRHSTAIHLLRSGVDLSTIANWLGHVSINTTNKYVTLDLEAKRQALDKAEPVLSDRQRENLPVPEHDLIEWLECRSEAVRTVCNVARRGRKLPRNALFCHPHHIIGRSTFIEHQAVVFLVLGRAGLSAVRRGRPSASRWS